MTDVRVSTWNELIDCLYNDAWHPDLQRFRAQTAFRGASHSGYRLVPSLARLGGDTRRLEEHILRAFIKYAQCEPVPGNSLWNWLALAQHHGLPTRLLDWTYSPMVAMHFATENMALYDVDSAIWSVNFARTNQLLPQSLRDVLADEGSDVFTAGMLGRVAETLQDLDALSDRPFVLFFEPPSLDARIVNQYALFSLLSDPRLRLDEWLAEHSDVVNRVIVPASLKWEVRDKLDQANITERVLFPGLDGLSAWLKRYYTPRRISRSAVADELEEEHAELKRAAQTPVNGQRGNEG